MVRVYDSREPSPAGNAPSATQPPAAAPHLSAPAVGNGRALYDQAGYISLRPSRSSTALLSMHNVNGPFAMSIEIASLKNLSGNLAWMSYVQQAAIRHNGRPHWGQENKLDAGTVAMMYGRALNDSR